MSSCTLSILYLVQQIETQTFKTMNQSPFSSCHFNTPCNNLMYFIDNFKISLLLSFLSEGCVGRSRRNSANAPLTFCCLNIISIWRFQNDTKKSKLNKIDISDKIKSTKIFTYLNLSRWFENDFLFPCPPTITLVQVLAPRPVELY